jgi:hypothetical protein
MSEPGKKERERAQRASQRNGASAPARASDAVGQSEGRSPSDNIDELRKQLRSLGYLDAGVDRFLLAPASGRRGALSVALRTGLRMGLLGAILLGPAAAIGIGTRFPGLLNGVRDAAVIAIYLAIFFLLAITVTSVMVALVSSAAVRVRRTGFAERAARVSRLAGWITSLACLAYLTLWWRNANAGFGWSAPAWTAFALLVAVAISLLLGHAQRITTLAVIAAGGAGGTLPPPSRRSWQVVAGGGALAFGGAALLLILAAPRDLPAATPPLTVVPTGIRLRVIALDGFDLATYLNHYDAATVFSDALHAPTQLAIHDTSDPARAWTTIATGAPPDVHGVHGIETRRVAGIRGILAGGGGRMAGLLADAADLARLTRPGLTSRDERRVKSIWEVAEDAGLRTAVINWWATWPATGRGIVISDRALVRIENGGALDGEIAPASLYEPLRAQWPAIRARAAEMSASSFSGITDPELLGVLRRSAELDICVVDILRALPGPVRDLDVIYLPGLDIAQHALLARNGTVSPPASVLAARVDGIGRYYEFLQRLVEPLLHVEGDEMAMLLTQPGRVASPMEGYIATVVAGSAPVTTRGSGAGTAFDVEPTIAYALGLPLSRELSGRPLSNLFAPAFNANRRAHDVPTYGRPMRVTTPSQGRPLDQEAIDRLRSLGYVK